ncbi:MAG: T9SS type A sorting domain-containing protein [Bacteroidales bacterium]|nr:T9SS type A sorting domain-containing protein [Bacteroidales bacterium]
MKSKIFLLNTLLLFCGISGFSIFYKVIDVNTGEWIVAIDKKDNYIFTAKWIGLFETIDVSNPTHPELVGSYYISDHIPGVAARIVISDTLAFVLGQTSIHILNITDPENPTYVKGLGYGYSRDIIISDNFAFIATYDHLQILDISDILNPQDLGSLYGELDGICFQNSMIYGIASGYPSHLIITDISDLFDPELVCSFELPVTGSTGGDIEIKGSHVFISQYRNLVSVNIADPLNPEISDNISIEDHTEKIFIQDNLAIINHSNSGIKVFDISQPTDITLMGYYDTPGRAENMVAEDDLVYVGNGYSGLQVIDISDNSNPYFISSIQTGRSTKGLAAKDEFIYIADRYTGLTLINTSNIYEPELTGSFFNMPGEANQLSILDNRICLGYDYPFGQLLFIDISEPEIPVLNYSVDFWYLMGDQVSTFQNQDYVFSGVYDTLFIFNVSDFGNPELLTKYHSISPITDVLVSENKGYLTLGNNGLEIIDLENIINPQFICTYDTPGRAVKMNKKDSLLFISNSEGGLQIVNIMDPANPEFLMSLNPRVNSNIVVKPLILGDKLIIVDKEWNEFSLYDISDMNNIYLMDAHQVNFEVYDMFYHNDILYCSSNYYGLIILDNSILVGTDDLQNTIPNEFKIYPNPAKGYTNIQLSISDRSTIRVNVYDNSGKLLRLLFHGVKDEGTHHISWDGKDEFGNALSSGIYFVQVIQNGFENCKKVILTN